MTAREQSAILRLALICAAWALGEALVWQAGAGGLGIVVPAILAAAAYLATRDIDRPRPDSTYWRGRPIDRDRWRH